MFDELLHMFDVFVDISACCVSCHGDLAQVHLRAITRRGLRPRGSDIDLAGREEVILSTSRASFRRSMI